MCGITGILGRADANPAVLAGMTRSLSHRGPDGQGVWTSPDGRVGLGHRRLSIVDPSSAGSQPMRSADGRVVLTFNGEIYNHLELRLALEQVRPRRWRGRSDTETLVEAIAEWGVELALTRSVGMFALALWDGSSLHLARDRFGEKPLYFGWAGTDLVFGSELKALRVHPALADEVDPDAVNALLRRGYIPAPRSIYRHVYKLEPGCILTADLQVKIERPARPPRAGYAAGGLVIREYWSYAEVVRQGISDPFSCEPSAVEHLDEALRLAVAGQTKADVPVGLFLSSGVDSSTLAAVMAASGEPVRTFSLGMEDPALNEAPDAARFAAYVGAEHHQILISTSDIVRTLEQLPKVYDEPFGDSSQIPTCLLSGFARPTVGVALCGDGGDELFGGYNRHLAAARYLPLLAAMPPGLRKSAAALLGRTPPSIWNAVLGRPGDHYLGHKARKALRAASQTDDLSEILSRFVDEWPGDGPPLANLPGLHDGDSQRPGVGAPPSRELMYLDAVTYLPGDLLTKVDRAAMAVGLETRMPYLDHRVAQAAARIPAHMNIQRRGGKHVLREVLERHATGHQVGRTKAGFGIPVAELLRGPLRGWAGDMLSTCDRGDMLDQGAISLAWSQHLSGQRDWAAGLWAVLMFRSWQETFRERPALTAMPSGFQTTAGFDLGLSKCQP